MALRFIDSFDHYQTAQLGSKWTTLGFITPDIVAGQGRCGTQAMFCNGSPGVSATKGLALTGLTGVFGGAFKFTSALSAFDFLYFGYLSAGNLFFRREIDGAISVYRDDAAPALLGSSAAGLINLGEYYYIEAKALIDPAAGSVVVRINGVVVLTIAGVDTTGNLTAGTGFSYIQLKAAASSGFYVDDVYMLDASGAVNNDFLGDTRIEYLHPDGAGATQGWDLIGGATHWQATYDSAGVDDDATYIHTSGVGTVDTETLSNTGLPSGAIYGLQANLYARKTDSGFRQVAPVLRHAGVDYTGTSQEPSTTYRYLQQLYETNPGTGAAWTIADVNALEAGAKLTA